MTLEEKVERLEELRRQVEGCESIEDVHDLLTEFDAALKDLIDAVEQKREADAQP
jgi:hypothetical protein